MPDIGSCIIFQTFLWLLEGVGWLVYYLLFLFLFFVYFSDNILRITSEVRTVFGIRANRIKQFNTNTYAYRMNFKLSPNLQSRMCNDVHKRNNTIMLRPITCNQYVTLNMCIYSVCSFFQSSHAAKCAPILMGRHQIHPRKSAMLEVWRILAHKVTLKFYVYVESYR